MTTKKYPIGTKIRFLNKTFDTNKTGVIVGLTFGNRVDIYLPTADKHIKENYHPTLPNGVKFTWHCRWDEIELLPQKNQQILFAFMDK